MSSYLPPSEDLPTFNPAVFSDNFTPDQVDSKIKTLQTEMDEQQLKTTRIAFDSGANETTITGTTLDVDATLELPNHSDVDTTLTNINTKLTGISYSAGEDETDIDTNSGNFKLSIQNKGIKIEGDPASTDGNDIIPLLGQTVGGSIQIRLLNRLGTGNSQNYHLYTNNFQRNASGFSIINTSYKAQKFETFQPAIGNSNSSSVAYQWSFYSTTGDDPSPSANILAYYDGRFQAPKLRTDEIDEIDGSAGVIAINSQLDVNGFNSGSFSGAKYSSSGTPSTASPFGGNYGAIIQAQCQADAFVASSSKKIKNVESSLSDVSTQNEALELFKSIPLSKYSYIDKVKNKSDSHYGLIAEDMPDNIYRYESKGYIPNIYQKGKVSFDQEKYTIKFNKALDFTKFENEDMSKIMCFMFDKDENNKVKKCKIDLCNVEIIDEYTIKGDFDKCKFCEGHQEDIFVYGVKGTIPSVKKEAYFELTSCVVKQLLEKVESLEQRIKELEK